MSDFSVDVQITAYSTDRILSEKTDKQSDRLIFYGEPIPETVGPLLEYTNSMPIQKMLVMDEKTRTDEIRPELYKVLDGRAEITVAIPGMLEVSFFLLFHTFLMLLVPQFILHDFVVFAILPSQCQVMQF